MAQGDLAPGTRLPTVRQLAADLGLAANTVARAYRELEADGVIATYGRKGTFVRSDGRRRLPRRLLRAGATGTARGPPPRRTSPRCARSGWASPRRRGWSSWPGPAADREADSCADRGAASAAASRRGGPSCPRAPTTPPRRRPGPRRARRPGRPGPARRAWTSRPMTVAPRCAQRGPQLDLGRGVQRRGDVVGQQQLGVAGQGAGQRQALHLPAGEPDAAVPDQRVGAAGGLDVGPSRAVSRAGRDRAVGVVEPDVVGEGARTAPAAPGRRGRPGPGAGTVCGSCDRLAVPADLAGAGRPARPARRAGWTCPSRPGRAAAPARRAPTVRSTSLAPRVPSSCTAVTPDQLEACAAGRAAPGGGARRGAVHQVDARRAGPSGRRRRRAGWWPASRPGCPGASVMTEPATRPNQSKPLTALATSSAVASPQPPATSTAQAATTPHCTITIGTPSSSACTRCSRTAASTRPPSTWRRWACTLGRRGRELDGAHRVQRRDQRAAEPGPRRRGRRGGAAGDRRPRVEASAEATITASRTPPASRLWAATRGHRDDHQAVDEVDPAVGVPGQPVGVHGPGDDLAGRRALEPVLRGLAERAPPSAPAASPRPTSAGSGGTPRPAAAARPSSETTSATVSTTGLPPSWSATTRCPQIQPVSAPNAPGQRGDQEEPDADQAPPRLDEQRRHGAPGPGSATSSQLGAGAGGSPARRAVPTASARPRPRPSAPACGASSSAAASSSARNGPGSRGQPARVDRAARPGRRRAPRPARRARSSRAGGRPAGRCARRAAARRRGRPGPR